MHFGHDHMETARAAAAADLGDELVDRIPDRAEDGVITSEELFRRREPNDE